MDGNIKQKKSSDSSSSTRASSSPWFSLFGFLRPRRVQKDIVQDTEAVSSLKLKVWPSDYDRGQYVAEPGIDRKASAFIEKFHASHNPPIAA